MNRGASRQMIFLDDHDRHYFMSCLIDASDRTDAIIHAYCLMGNHYHLLIETPKGNLDQMIHLMARRYSRYFNDKYKRDGRVCRDRYLPILIDSDQYLIAVSRYIHRNPTVFGLPFLSDYPWSSYPEYLGLRRAEDWLEVDRTLSLCGGVVGYKALVENLLPTEIDQLYTKSRMPQVVGSQEFLKAAIARRKTLT